MSLTEDKIHRYVKQFSVLQESQLAELMQDTLTEEKLHRTLVKMWKKNMLKWGGPDNAFVMLNSGSDNVDTTYVDCIWVLLEHAECEEDIETAFCGKDMLKISYFSRSKQNTYNIFYIRSEEDYPSVSFINSRYLSATDEDMIEGTRFLFVSDSEDILKKMPLAKFAFPCMRIQLDYSANGAYAKPKMQMVT